MEKDRSILAVLWYIIKEVSRGKSQRKPPAPLPNVPLKLNDIDRSVDQVI